VGADIHAFVEYKVDKEYFSLAEINFGRNYELFGLLAGVRGGEPLFDPKGSPTDMSWDYGSALRTYGEDAHSASFLTADEFSEVAQAWDERYADEDKWTGIRLFAIYKMLADLPNGRLNFFFDN
jgi:hypothetical protein